MIKANGRPYNNLFLGDVTELLTRKFHGNSGKIRGVQTKLELVLGGAFEHIYWEIFEDYSGQLRQTLLETLEDFPDGNNPIKPTASALRQALRKKTKELMRHAREEKDGVEDEE